MKILALETSAKSVSAAVTDGGVVRAYTYQNTGLTHSRTLMPLVDAMLRESEQSLADMDLLAVAAGPGSFTGLRIGVSTLKGLAWAADKPCCGVSTLEAMAQNLRHMDGLIVCSMDARRSQVYNAVFAAEGGQLTRLTPDRAIALSQLAEELQNDPRPKLVVGDGAALCSGFLSEAGIPCRMAPAQLVMQNAVGVALAAEEMAARGETEDHFGLIQKFLYAEDKTMSNQFPTLHIVDHPLVQHKLSVMRDKNTSVKDFRALVGEIAMLLTYEATRDLPMTTRTIETPICSYEAPVLAGKKLAIVPILRAGLGFEDGILTLVPSARVAHIGMYRDEETLEPHFYFLKYPKDIAGRDVLIVDPMLATGGSADMAITKMKELGCKNIKLMILVAAPEGVKFIYERHPDVDIYCAALDDHLNENGYIVPGLGDAGDRIFGTK